MSTMRKFVFRLMARKTFHSARWLIIFFAGTWTNASIVAHGAEAAPLGRRFQRPEIVAAPSAQPASEHGEASRDAFQTLPGFQVERIFTVPREEMGSWVSLTTDGQGRLIASDQEDKGLYRITPAPLDGSGSTTVERLNVGISSAQGLL